MPVEVIMPKVDMDMSSGRIVQWHAKEGDTVKVGEPLFDIETDKANMEVESPACGILQQVAASNGDTIDIGVCIAYIYVEGEQLISPGEVALTGQHIPPSATDAEQKHDAVEDPDCIVTTQAPDSSPSDAVSLPCAVKDKAEKVRATPLARKFAEQYKVNLSSLSGSGPRGRITRQDVESAVNDKPLIDGKATAQALTVASTTQLDSLGIAYSCVPLDRMRLTIANRLTQSKASVPHFYLECDCRMDKLLAYRQELNTALGNNAGIKISLNDLIVMAAGSALDAEPDANVAWAGTQVIQFHDANVSVAVAVDGGLMTPVVRATQKKSIMVLSAELAELSTRARQGKLSPREYQGGSMSISNLGMFGVQRFQAIINPPESMILAVGAASPKIVVGDNDQPCIRRVMSVCLSCDHRVLDGVVAARWLQAFRDWIENPIR